jgi:hypothetical protein
MILNINKYILSGYCEPNRDLLSDLKGSVRRLSKDRLYSGLFALRSLSAIMSHSNFRYLLA